MNDLLVLRAAVVASLQAKLGPAISVEPHGGSFSLEELKRIALRAPAVRVAITGVGKASRFNDGRWKVPTHFAAVVVTRDTAVAEKISRDTAALLIVSALQLALASNRFGLEGVFQPEGLEARNEYSGKVDELGLAMWQVNWTSDVLLGDEGGSAAVVIAALIKEVVNGEVMWTSAGGLSESDPLNSVTTGTVVTAEDTP